MRFIGEKPFPVVQIGGRGEVCVQPSWGSGIQCANPLKNSPPVSGIGARSVCRRPEFCVVTGSSLGYAGGMLWKKTWEPEAVLALLGGVVASFLVGGLASGLLARAHAPGFQSDDGLGSVLVATLSFHGAALVLGTVFLKFHESSWREVLGRTGWKHCLALACVILLAVSPLLYSLKWVSDLVLLKLYGPVQDQAAVRMILDAKPWLRCYLAVFAVVLAPVAEEFVFRGLLFSLAKQYGWPKLGWLGVSALFALIHFNGATFLPLFVLALALTWLYEVTEGLLAPILAHAVFNAANLVLLLVAEKYNLMGT